MNATIALILTTAVTISTIIYQCDPIGDRNSSCALGMKRVCGQLLAESG